VLAGHMTQACTERKTSKTKSMPHRIKRIPPLKM